MIISNAMVCTAIDHGDKQGVQDQEVRERQENEEKAGKGNEQGKQEAGEFREKLSSANESEPLPACLSHLRVSAI
jgi:hypothetical protein